MKKIILILFAFIIGLSQLLFQTGCKSCNGDLPQCNLPAPNSLVATPVTSTSVNLNWSLVPTALNYNVQIFSIDEADSLTLVQTLNNVNPSLIVNGLTPDVLYKAFVRANCSGIPSINSSDINFRLSGILIEDVVMIKEKSIMNPMQNSQCNGTSETNTVESAIRINWEPAHVYCLEISDTTKSSNVKIKIGFKDATTIQYLNISGINWTSAIVSDHIVIKDASSNPVGKITFNDFSFKLTKLSSFNLKLKTTRY